MSGIFISWSSILIFGCSILSIELFVLKNDTPFSPNFSLVAKSKSFHVAVDFIKMKSEMKILSFVYQIVLTYFENYFGIFFTRQVYKPFFLRLRWRIIFRYKSKLETFGNKAFTGVVLKSSNEKTSSQFFLCFTTIRCSVGTLYFWDIWSNSPWRVRFSSKSNFSKKWWEKYTYN